VNSSNCDNGRYILCKVAVVIIHHLDDICHRMLKNKHHKNVICNFSSSSIYINLLGSRDGAVVRVLAPHQSGPGSMPTQSHKNHVGQVCYWFSPCSEGFSEESPLILPPQPTSPNSNSTRVEECT